MLPPLHRLHPSWVQHCPAFLWKTNWKRRWTIPRGIERPQINVPYTNGRRLPSTSGPQPAERPAK
jgi:hypothetical protein